MGMHESHDNRNMTQREYNHLIHKYRLVAKCASVEVIRPWTARDVLTPPGTTGI